jgi:hypothetical protein
MRKSLEKRAFQFLIVDTAQWTSPRVDLSIGAALLTSSELVFGTLIGDPWVDNAR